MTNPTKLVAYVRVSTDQQANEGISLDAQRSSIAAWALANGHTISAWYTEAASAKDTKRPELQRALDEVLHGGVDGLVVTKVDRLSRSVIDFATLMDDFTKAEKALVCVGDSIDMTTPSGRFVAGILAGLAQLERELIGQRTKDALAEKKRQGVRLGRPPSEDVPLSTVQRVRFLSVSGLSQRKIADLVGLKPGTVRRLIAG